MNEINLLIIGIVIGCIIWYLIHQSTSWSSFSRTLKIERRSAIQQSKQVTLGQISEQLAPLIPDFPYHVKDMVFIGKWFDYLVLDWLSEGQIRRIVFLEIKTWRSTQNMNERKIQQTIDHKLVSYEIIRI